MTGCLFLGWIRSGGRGGTRILCAAAASRQGNRSQARMVSREHV